jgi:hypothetical protein
MSKDKNRFLLESHYGSLYNKMKNCDIDKCWYCSSIRQCLDHCPNLSQLNYYTPEDFARQKIELLLIPSCNQCNSYLNQSQSYAPKDRLNDLYLIYAREIRNSGEYWKKDELKTLSKGWLKNSIIHNNLIIDSLKEKLSNIMDRLLQDTKNHV